MRARGYTLDITTPESIALPFAMASMSRRAGALLIDVTLMAALLLLLRLVGWFAASAIAGSTDYVDAVLLFLFFALRNVYFPLSELRWRGQTLGKRMMGIRVIAVDGGPLTPALVFTRNLTRELEIFLPLAALFVPKLLFAEPPDWARLLCAVWAVVFGLLPWFSQYKQRVGDIVAGTVVVVTPITRLLQEVTLQHGHHGAAAAYSFRPDQLDIYGIRELQTLEDALRQAHVSPHLLWDICERIKLKIGWDRQQWQVDPERFLRAFYAAQRAHLEQKMLMGEKRERRVR